MVTLPPGSSLGFLLTDLSRLSRQMFERRALETGLDLTAGEIRALTYVSRYSGSRQTTLAERMGIEPMTLSAYLDRLERRGLVERSPDPSDRRAKVIHPTKAAEAVFEEILPVASAVYDKAVEGLTLEQRQVMEESLALMRKNLSSAYDPLGQDAPEDGRRDDKAD